MANDDRSGLARAGEILLLVGTILRAVAAVIFLLLVAALTGWSGVRGAGGDPAFVLVSVVYGLMGVLFLVSAIVAFSAWQRAKAGQFRSPGIRGIVASMLPPVDVVLLLGGIFLMVCDEAKTEPATPYANRPPADPPSRWMIREE